MDEIKLFGEIYKVNDRLDKVEDRLVHIETGLAHLTNVTDKVLHVVERLDQEKTVTSHRLDEHSTRITALEQTVKMTN